MRIFFVAHFSLPKFSPKSEYRWSPCTRARQVDPKTNLRRGKKTGEVRLLSGVGTARRMLEQLLEEGEPVPLDFIREPVASQEAHTCCAHCKSYEDYCSKTQRLLNG